MPIALTTLPDPPLTPGPPRKRWTREECRKLASSGLLAYEHLELIEGELIDKMGKNQPHVTLLRRMQFWLEDAFGRERVNAESPIDIAPADNPINEPEPDLIVRKDPDAATSFSRPQPSDLLLVVEISDSSLRFDLSVKALLYARAGIPEYWALDINGRRLIVHREPASTGYVSVVAYSGTDQLSPLAAPDRTLVVADCWPR